MESNEFQKRRERAQNRSGTIHVRREDPVILEFDSDHSGDTHTIVPNIAYCGCSDARYRGMPCWHLLHATASEDVPSDVRETLSEAIERRAEELLGNAEEAVEEAAQARDDAVIWHNAAGFVRDSVTIDHARTAGENSDSFGDRMADFAGEPGPLCGSLGSVADSATVD